MSASSSAEDPRALAAASRVYLRDKKFRKPFIVARCKLDANQMTSRLESCLQQSKRTTGPAVTLFITELDELCNALLAARTIRYADLASDL